MDLRKGNWSQDRKCPGSFFIFNADWCNPAAYRSPKPAMEVQILRPLFGYFAHKKNPNPSARRNGQVRLLAALLKYDISCTSFYSFINQHQRRMDGSVWNPIPRPRVQLPDTHSQQRKALYKNHFRKQEKNT